MSKFMCPHVCKDCYAAIVCAVRAIEEKPNAISLIEEACIGCGSCKTACEAFGNSMIKHRMIRPERVEPLPPPPGSPWR